MNVRFAVNGSECEIDSGNRCSLVEHLRDTLGLKGTRYGCGQEQCGACVVLVDDEPRYSCQMEVGNLQGRAVTTIEGIAASREGRALLAAFERRQAIQCGFCASGVLVRAAALLRGGGDGSRAAIARALEPHLCRCGSHPRILAAIELAWRELHGGEAPS
jgi:nicotinate dehydrogenase subunit A